MKDAGLSRAARPAVRHTDYRDHRDLGETLPAGLSHRIRIASYRPPRWATDVFVVEGAFRSMGRKPETARADHEAGDPPDHFTEGLRADLLLEQKRSLEQLNAWFEIALNNMV